jgi:hypothetical protein
VTIRLDLNAVHAELADACRGLGYQVHTHIPETTDFPAIVIRSPTVITYHHEASGGVALEQLVTVLASLASASDAVKRLNTALTEVPVTLEAHTPTDAAWRQAIVQTASEVRLVTVGDTAKALAVDLNLLVVV